MDKLLNRKKSAEYSNEKGVRSSSVTLARLAEVVEECVRFKSIFKVIF